MEPVRSEDERRQLEGEGETAYHHRLGRATCPYAGWRQRAWLDGWWRELEAESDRIAAAASQR